MTPHPKAASTNQDTTPQISPQTKLGKIVRLLQRAKGATLDDLEMVTGWQRHSIRGAISGSLRGKHGLAVDAITEETRGRVYRIKKTPKTGGYK